MQFGIVPPEPHRQSGLDCCAPKFAAAVMALLRDMQDGGFDAFVYETCRTPERQAWLWGFSREYDDGDGWRTNARSPLYSWHGYGLAVDIISRSKGWDDPTFFDALGVACDARDLAWGGHWREKDLPHVQWGPPMRQSPSSFARALHADAGAPAVWREVGAV